MTKVEAAIESYKKVLRAERFVETAKEANRHLVSMLEDKDFPAYVKGTINLDRFSS